MKRTLSESEGHGRQTCAVCGTTVDTDYEADPGWVCPFCEEEMTDELKETYEADCAGCMGFMYIRVDGTALWVGHIDRNITRKEADAVVLRHNRGSRDPE